MHREVVSFCMLTMSASGDLIVVEVNKWVDMHKQSMAMTHQID